MYYISFGELSEVPVSLAQSKITLGLSLILILNYLKPSGTGLGVVLRQGPFVVSTGIQAPVPADLEAE